MHALAPGGGWAGAGDPKEGLQRLELDESLSGGSGCMCIAVYGSIAVLAALSSGFWRWADGGCVFGFPHRRQGYEQSEIRPAFQPTELTPLILLSVSLLRTHKRNTTRSARRSRFPIRPVRLLWRWVARVIRAWPAPPCEDTLLYC